MSSLMNSNSKTNYKKIYTIIKQFYILPLMLFCFCFFIGCGGGGGSGTNINNQSHNNTTIQPPDYIPNLIINSPKKKFYTLNNTIKVEGEVDENIAFLTLNGTRITITNNSFSLDYKLQNGKNDLVFDAYISEGKRITLKKTLYFGIYNIIVLNLKTSLVYSAISPLNNIPQVFSYDIDSSLSEQISFGSQFVINKEPSLCSSKVAFISIDFLGSSNNSVTNNHDPEIGYKNPALSPDCTKIAFSSNILEKTNWDIYILDLQNPIGPSSIKRITSTPNNEDSPSWSSSGKKISFHSTSNNGTSEIYIIDLEKKPLVMKKILSSTYPALNPDWAPNKDEILFQIQSPADGLFRSLSQLPEPDTSFNYNNLAKINLFDNKISPITTDKNNFIKPKWNKDGTMVGYINNNRNGKICYRKVENINDEECFPISAISFDW